MECLATPKSLHRLCELKEKTNWRIGPHQCLEMVLEQIGWRSGNLGCIRAFQGRRARF